MTLFKQNELTDSRVQALLRVHLENARALTPLESTHALDIEGLKDPAVTFWTLWRDDKVLGGGALKEQSARHGEVKSMHTYEKYRGQGFGGMILTHILKTARERGYSRISLETGQPPDYASALALYKKFGFTDCPPFANYRVDPFSRYMTLVL